MKRYFVLACLAFSFGCGLRAQAVDTTVCDVVKNPAPFDGKTVRMKATVVAGFDEFVIKDAADPNCGFPVNAIWLAYPAGTKGKAGPVAILEVQPAHNFAGTFKPATRAAVTLDKSKEFKQFDNLLSQPHQKGADMCLGCTRYEVTATLTGRLDTVADASLKRDASGKITGFGGFGNMNMYPARLVLQSVADVTPKEVDYSKTDAITKGDAVLTPPPSGGGEFDDPFASAQKMAAHMAGNPAGDETIKAVGVFPKGKEQSDVTVTFGMNDEANPKDEDQSQRDSPDGVLFNCWFVRDRLQGNALPVAIAHIGEEIVSLRSPKADEQNPEPIALENNAWVITEIEAIAAGQKFLTLPGGFLVWNAAWTPDERTDKMSSGLQDYLSKEALLSR